MSKDLVIKKLKEKLQELKWIKDFQQNVILEFEKVTGKELAKELLPKHSANEIQKKKEKIKVKLLYQVFGVSKQAYYKRQNRLKTKNLSMKKSYK